MSVTEAQARRVARRAEMKWDRAGLVTSSLSRLRAVLTSALGQPCLDLELELDSKSSGGIVGAGAGVLGIKRIASTGQAS